MALTFGLVIKLRQFLPLFANAPTAGLIAVSPLRGIAKVSKTRKKQVFLK
ncbi:MAG: hypothetical protein HRU33_23790 [Rhodobacteraceae bacterium]|nr:hypothetical protein [Paracoccaceae bacterium]